MIASAWQDHLLDRQDLHLAWYDAGSGPPVFFLQGGPGDDHQPMRALAAPLVSDFHCVLHDPRGTGRSHLARLDPSTLHLDRLVDDIEALRQHLGSAKISLIGHSWGANLALAYSAQHPEQVERVVLVSLGPLNVEMHAVARANLLKPLTRQERERLTTLTAERQVACALGEEARQRALHLQFMELRLRAWFAGPEAAETFLEFYRKSYGYQPAIAPLLQPSVEAWHAQIDHRLPGLHAPVLIVYGYQDFEPITQAFVLQARLPQARIALLNACGHVPWIEQPEAFYAVLRRFFAGSMVANEG